MIVVDYKSEMGDSLGKGFDLSSGTLKSFLMENNKYKETEIKHSDIRLDIIENRRDLDVFVSSVISVESSSFGFGYSSSIDILNSISLTERNVFIVFSAEVISKSVNVSSDKMSGDALKLLDNPNSFDKIYGSTYVYSVIYGSKIFVLIEIGVKSIFEKNELIASISAHGKSGSVSAEYRNSMINKISSYKKNVSIKSLGLSIKDMPDDVDDIMNIFNHFDDISKNSSSPLYIGLKPINSMLNYSGDIKTEYKRELMRMLFEKYVGYSEFLARINLMLNRDDFYDMDGFDFRPLIKTKKNVEQIILEIIKKQKLIVDGVLDKIDVDDSRLLEAETKLPNVIFVVKPKDVIIYPLDLYNGDGEMNGALGAKIEVEANLFLSEDKKLIIMNIRNQIEEMKGDYSSFKKEIPGIVVFDLRGSGFYVERFWPNSGFIRTTAIPDTDWHNYAGRGVISDADCRVDTIGSEVGKIGASPIRFNNINVSVKRDN